MEFNLHTGDGSPTTVLSTTALQKQHCLHTVLTGRTSVLSAASMLTVLQALR